MSVISNQFAAGLGQPNALAELSGSPAMVSEPAWNYAPPSDGISCQPHNPITLPIEGPLNPISIGEGGFTGGTSGGWSFSGILNQMGNVINSIFNQLGSYLSSLAGGTSQTPTSPAETFYSNATSSSTGDPHLAFNGTTGAGTDVNAKWNDQQSHANLLSSDSFAGGYTESTTTTPVNSNGVAYNASASVATDAGGTSVTMNANGSYAVTEDGQNVTLQSGQTTQLGNGESVTLNSNGSLTVADANGQGGSISTTLQSHGTYVDVTNSAQNVDLGGYLVDKNDNDVSAVSEYGQQYAATTSPYQFTTMPISQQEPSFAENFSEFDPDAENTSLQNIELA